MDSEEALLVIDVQNNLCHPEGAFAALSVRQLLVPVCRDVLRSLGARAARAQHIPVIFTRAEYLPDYADAGLVSREVLDPRLEEAGSLVAGTWETQILADLGPMPVDYVIPKNRSSSFYGTQLEPLLRSSGITTLTICGVSTSCCVESTTRDAVERGYVVTVAGDATGELDREMYEFTLRTLERDFCRVTDTARVISDWSRS